MEGLLTLSRPAPSLVFRCSSPILRHKIPTHYLVQTDVWTSVRAWGVKEDKAMVSFY